MKKNNTIVQLFLYLIVGAGATVVEWAAFYLLNDTAALHYTWATALAFCISTLANWLLGRLIMFKKTNQSLLTELVQIYSASIVGLILNLIIMWIAIDLLGFQEMVSKIIATGIVFFWNFLIRKILIYRQ